MRRNELRAWNSGIKTDQKFISKTIIVSALEDIGRGGVGNDVEVLMCHNSAMQAKDFKNIFNES